MMEKHRDRREPHALVDRETEREGSSFPEGQENSSYADWKTSWMISLFYNLKSIVFSQVRKSQTNPSKVIAIIGNNLLSVLVPGTEETKLTKNLSS